MKHKLLIILLIISIITSIALQLRVNRYYGYIKQYEVLMEHSQSQTDEVLVIADSALIMAWDMKRQRDSIYKVHKQCKR